jgi:hypothetical protein
MTKPKRGPGARLRDMLAAIPFGEGVNRDPYFGLVRIVSFGSSTILLIPGGADK